MPLIVTELLRSMDIFEELPLEDIEMVASLLAEEKISAGTVLFHQSDEGTAMYIVTGGRFKLFTTDDSGAEKVLTHFGDSDFFGEMALLTGAPRSASVQAVEDSRVLVLRKEPFDQFIASNVVVMREMLKVVAKRQTATNVRLAQDEESQRIGIGTGKVYVIYSPRGGSGKTTMAVNLAAALARQNPDRVALLDLDLTFGHVAMMLHLSPAVSLADIPPESLRSLDRESLNRYLLTHSSGMRVFVGANRPEEGEAVTGEHVKAALEVMKRQFLFIVVDTSSSFAEPILAALEMADKVALVCTPELHTVRDVRECQRIFSDVIHVPREKLVYVMNQYQPFRILANEQFEQALEVQLLADVPHAGETGMKAALEGKPLYLAGPSASLVKGFDKLAASLQDGAVNGVGKGQKGSKTGRRLPLAKAKKPAPSPRPPDLPASIAAPSTASEATYPVRLLAAPPATRSRLRALLRLPLAVVPLAAALVMQILALLIVVLAWFAILLRGRMPRRSFDLIGQALRLNANAVAYFTLLTDSFPPLNGDAASPRVASYPVQVIIPYPERSSRLKLLLRFFSLLPHAVVGMLYSILLLVATFAAWWLVIVTATYPPSIFALVLALNRYFLRVAAYTSLLIDRFPPIGLKA